MLARLLTRSLLAISISGPVLAQDTSHFAPANRISIFNVSALAWQPLGARIRVKSVIGTVGTFSLAEFDSGAVAAVHHHTREQANLGWSAGLHMTVDSQTVALGVGTAVLVPPDVAHGLENIGGSPASMIEFHTVRRLDLVPPRPRTSFPRGATPAPIPSHRRVFAAYDSTYQPDPGNVITIDGSSSSLRIQRLSADSELMVHTDPAVLAEQLLFVLHGEGQIADGVGTRTVSSGTVLVVPANVPAARLRSAVNKQLVLATFSIRASR